MLQNQFIYHIQVLLSAVHELIIYAGVNTTEQSPCSDHSHQALGQGERAPSLHCRLHSELSGRSIEYSEVAVATT